VLAWPESAQQTIAGTESDVRLKVNQPAVRDTAGTAPLRDATVVQYIDSACPRCQHAIRIRTEYVGRRLACKYCNHSFVAEATAQASQSAVATDLESARTRISSLEEEVQQLRTELATRAPEHATESQRFQELKGELGRAREQVQGLQVHLGRVIAREQETAT